MTQQIETISLTDMLPKVFTTEDVPESNVWRTKLTLRRGEFYMIEAASGAGKSSLCSYIYGARTDYEGILSFNGEDTSMWKPERWQRLRRENLAYLPQELALFPELTAWQNIQLKNTLTNHVSDSLLKEWLERLGIANRSDYPVGKMSIGQQQRVAIIRAICQPFDFILLDEPVSHLDANNNRIAAEIITEEANRQGAGIIATSVGNAIDIPGMKRLKL